MKNNNDVELTRHMNLLEAKLKAVQDSKRELKKQMKSENDRKKLISIAEDIRELTKEETEILTELGVFKR